MRGKESQDPEKSGVGGGERRNEEKTRTGAGAISYL